MSLPAWNSNAAYNKYTDTYFRGTVDASGGDVILRTGSLNLVTGGIKAGSISVPNAALGYCAGFVSDAQQQITNLAATAGGLVTKTQNISFTGSTTTVSNALVFSGTLNGVSPSTFGYISGLTSSAQTQLSTLASGVASNTANLTNIIYNPISTYTDMVNVYISTDLIVNAATKFNNTVTLIGSISANGQTVTPIQIGYLSGLTADVQTAITNLNTNTAGVVAGGGGYTNINFLDVTDYFYSATGSQLDGTTLITGPLSMSSTASIIANSISITPTALSYLANVTSDIQAQFSSTSGVTSGAQTWAGIKTFSSPPVLVGTSITNIPDAALISTFVKTTGAVTITGIKTFSTPPVLVGTSITGIPDTALVENYLKLGTVQTVTGLKTFSNNVVFSGNPSFTNIPTFVNATFTGTAANSPTFASLYTSYLQIQSTAAGTGLIFNNNGSTTVAGGFLWSRYNTPTNPQTQIGDWELGVLQGSSTNGLSIGISTTSTNGIRLLPNSITFNSPIVITGSITSNSQTVTTTQLGYVSGATSNLQTQITSSATTIGTHTTNITDLQTKTANIGAVGTTTTIYNNLSIGNTSITGLLTLPTSYSPLPTLLQLGGSTSSSPASNGVIASATPTNVTSITISNLGVFLLTWNITFKTTTGNITAYLRGGVNSTSATFQSNNVSYSGSQNVDTTGTSLHGSTVFTNTSASVTYYLVSYQSSLTSLNYTTNSYLQIVRIA